MQASFIFRLAYAFLKGGAKQNNLPIKVLAVASGGGHWEQLMLLRGALADCEVHFATTIPALIEGRQIENGHLLADCNRGSIHASLKCLFQSLRLLMNVKPDVVISTGAAPGLFCLLFARVMRAKTIWIDSVANVERLSLSGKISMWFVDVCLTQWPHLAKPEGPRFAGAVL